MTILDIEIGNELLLGIQELAERHYGDREAASLSRVVEDALHIRLILLERLGNPGQEVEEPIINWEPQEPEGEKKEADIQGWLFRRRSS